MDKTISLLEKRYYWPYLRKEIARNVQKCFVFQSDKGGVYITELYMPLPMPSTVW